MNITQRTPGLTSGLTSLRGTNPKLAAAMSAVPKFDLMSTMLADLVDGAKTITPPASRDEVTAEVFASLAAGDGIPADTLARYTEAAVAEQAFISAQDDLDAIYVRLVQERDSLLQSGLASMCGALNDDLQRIYSAMRELLPFPANAEQAIALGKVDQFKKASALRSEYFQIRGAHRTLLSSGISKTDDEFRYLSKGWPIVGHAASLGAIWPDLPEWHKYGKKLGDAGRLVKLTPPWPDPDTEAFLDWLLGHPEANPWVPTFEQATELLNQIVKNAQTLYETNRSPDQEELAREYERRQRMWGSNSPAHVIN